MTSDHTDKITSWKNLLKTPNHHNSGCLVVRKTGFSRPGPLPCKGNGPACWPNSRIARQGEPGTHRSLGLIGGITADGQSYVRTRQLTR